MESKYALLIGVAIGLSIGMVMGLIATILVLPMLGQMSMGMAPDADTMMGPTGPTNGPTTDSETNSGPSGSSQPTEQMEPSQEVTVPVYEGAQMTQVPSNAHEQFEVSENASAAGFITRDSFEQVHEWYQQPSNLGNWTIEEDTTKSPDESIKMAEVILSKEAEASIVMIVEDSEQMKDQIYILIFQGA